MRKDESGLREYCGHSRNTAVAKRGWNKRVRKNVKHHLDKFSPEVEASNRPTSKYDRS
jgi:hypothetical protein